MNYKVQYKTVISNIKRLRIRAHLTQGDLAKRAGVTTGMICRIEKGQRDPSLRLLCRIAGGLGVKPVQLLRNPDDERSRRKAKHTDTQTTDEPMGVAIMLGDAAHA